MRISKEGKVKTTNWLTDKVLSFAVLTDDDELIQCTASNFFVNDIHPGRRMRVYGHPDNSTGVLRVSSAIIDPPQGKVNDWDF